MLAEKRYKQKWSDDPRNTRWSKESLYAQRTDQGRYGYRMLQRMGWSQGQGLGRRKEGREELVRVSRRDDNSGVGFNRSHDAGWIEHQEAFDQILAGLNADIRNDTVTTSSCSGEAKSLLSSAVNSGRAVYKKFLQSKDLSVVSSDELNCVLGKRAREKTSRRGRENKEDAPVISHGITTITRKQTAQEYFATKLSTRRVTLEKDTQRTAHGLGLLGGVSGGCGDGEGVESDLHLVTAEGDQHCEGDSGGCGDGEGVESDLHRHYEPRLKRRKTSSKKHKHLHKRH